jgi:hypothetical protein
VLQKKIITFWQWRFLQQRNQKKLCWRLWWVCRSLSLAVGFVLVRLARIIALMMEAVRTSETVVYFNETTRSYISEG